MPRPFVPRFRPGRRAMLRALASGSVALLLPAALGVRAARAAPMREGGEEPADPPGENTGAIPLLIPDDVGEDERWVDVNLTEQAAVAMIGREWTHVALATTGKPGWETPAGEYRILYRVANETMTSASLGIDDPNDQYVLTDVLYTQYFTWEGHALHLNYWRSDSVFGYQRTSHGCVGVRLPDARFLWDHLATGSRVVIHA